MPAKSCSVARLFARSACTPATQELSVHRPYIKQYIKIPASNRVLARKQTGWAKNFHFFDHQDKEESKIWKVSTRAILQVHQIACEPKMMHTWTGLKVMPVISALYFLDMCRLLPPMPHPTSTPCGEPGWSLAWQSAGQI